MTEKQARAVATGIMAAAALGTVVFVMRSPKLRRIAWQFARQYASGPLAVWAAGSVRDAWDASTSARPRTSRATVDRSAGDPMVARPTVDRVSAGLLPASAAADRPR